MVGCVGTANFAAVGSVENCPNFEVAPNANGPSVGQAESDASPKMVSLILSVFELPNMNRHHKFLGENCFSSLCAGFCF